MGIGLVFVFASMHSAHRLDLKNKLFFIMGLSWWSSDLRLLASTAGGTGSIPGWGTEISHAINKYKNFLKIKKNKLFFIVILT